jgi:NAD(P)-dependent dehydrogenase (short-subunit alcohol dehydrogenase family)
MPKPIDDSGTMTKHIVITGVAHGLGRAMTQEFIALGHQVMGCDVDCEAIAQLQQQFPEHYFKCVDVMHDSQVKAWADEIEADHSAPDLLINNAGVMHPLASLWEIPASTVDRILDINVKGVIHVIRHLVPLMVAQQRGTIINISAKWGRIAAPQAALFCASKWAIEGLTQALAQELPPGMAAVTFSPTAVHTQALEIIHGVEKAKTYITPNFWASETVPVLLSIGSEMNGRSLT